MKNRTEGKGYEQNIEKAQQKVSPVIQCPGRDSQQADQRRRQHEQQAVGKNQNRTDGRSFEDPVNHLKTRDQMIRAVEFQKRSAEGVEKITSAKGCQNPGNCAACECGILIKKINPEPPVRAAHFMGDGDPDHAGGNQGMNDLVDRKQVELRLRVLCLKIVFDQVLPEMDKRKNRDKEKDTDVRQIRIGQEQGYETDDENVIQMARPA